MRRFSGCYVSFSRQKKKKNEGIKTSKKKYSFLFTHTHDVRHSHIAGIYWFNSCGEGFFGHIFFVNYIVQKIYHLFFFLFRLEDRIEKETSNMAVSDIYHRIPKRYVLSILGFLGFFNALILRSNLSIAIVAMVKPTIEQLPNNITKIEPVM